MSPILGKIKAIAVAAVLSFVAATAVYLTTDVDYTVFGPTAGVVASTIIGYAVKEYRPVVEDYLKSL